MDVHGLTCVPAKCAAVAERQIVIEEAAEHVRDIRVTESVVQPDMYTYDWKATSAVVCAIPGPAKITP